MKRDKDLRACDPQSLIITRAVAVSLRQFLPVEIPSAVNGSQRKNQFRCLLNSVSRLVHRQHFTGDRLGACSTWTRRVNGPAASLAQTVRRSRVKVGGLQ